jgi:hypothetical protein
LTKSLPELQVEAPVQATGLPPVISQLLLALQLRFVGWGLNKLPRSKFGSAGGAVFSVTVAAATFLPEATPCAPAAKTATVLRKKAERTQIWTNRFKIVMNPPF